MRILLLMLLVMTCLAVTLHDSWGIQTDKPSDYWRLRSSWDNLFQYRMRSTFDAINQILDRAQMDFNADLFLYRNAKDYSKFQFYCDRFKRTSNNIKVYMYKEEQKIQKNLSDRNSSSSNNQQEIIEENQIQEQIINYENLHPQDKKMFKKLLKQQIEENGFENFLGHPGDPIIYREVRYYFTEVEEQQRTAYWKQRQRRKVQSQGEEAYEPPRKRVYDELQKLQKIRVDLKDQEDQDSKEKGNYFKPNRDRTSSMLQIGGN